VQSRPQFGYVGAAVTLWVFALINYVGYNTADAILSGSAMNSLFGIPAELGFVIAAAWRRCSRSTAITGSTGSTAG
jgi:nucleobase:cation symporter-1, NCS1 family